MLAKIRKKRLFSEFEPFKLTTRPLYFKTLATVIVSLINIYGYK